MNTAEGYFNETVYALINQVRNENIDINTVDKLYNICTDNIHNNNIIWTTLGENLLDILTLNKTRAKTLVQNSEFMFMQGEIYSILSLVRKLSRKM